MGRSSIGSGNNSPFRVIPCLGQLSDHGAPIWWPSITSHKDAWHVLQDDESWSHLPNDSEGIGEKVSIICGAFAESGVAVRLAGEPGSDDIHDSTPGSAVEGFDVIPDGSGSKRGWVIFESLEQDLLTVLVPLDIGDRAEVGVRVGESEAEREPAIAGETVENVESSGM